MRDLELLVGPGLDKVTAKNISGISISYSLKDYKNYGERNASFTKPMSILQTAETSKIFKSLFNINSVNGYEVGKKVYGELKENGISILKGSLQITEITNDTYEVVLTSNTISLFNDIGDKLIKGNLDSSDDLAFAETDFQHTWNRAKVRAMGNTTPSPDGTGYCYPLIAYDNNLSWPLLINFNTLWPNALIDDYKVLPSIAAKQIFDKIFSDNGYSYSMSTEMEDYLKKLYLPFNDDWVKYTVPAWKYGKYYLGSPSQLNYTTTTIKLTPYAVNNWFTTMVMPVSSVMGWTFVDSSLAVGNRVSGGFDYMHNYPSTQKTTNVGIELPHAGNFIVDVSMWLYNGSGTAGDSEWSITTWNEKDGNVVTPLTSVTVNGNAGAYLNSSVDVAVSEKSNLFIHRSTSSLAAINLVFGSWSKVEISERNSLIGNSPTFNLNNMLPRGFKQSEFLNDIFKMFNAYITVDDIDEKKLYIKTYKDFYSNYKVYDWTKKIDTASVKCKPLKNTFAKNTTFSFTDDSDIYSEDYSGKFSTGIYSKKIINDTEFGGSDVAITLNSAPGTITKFPQSTIYSVYPVDTSLYVLQLNDDKQFKTTWKPRFLFANTFDASIVYGSDASTAADPWIRKITTLSPRLLQDKNSSTNLFLGFDSTYSYTYDLTETNETLFNKFYKEDIENNISDEARLYTAKANLTSKDIHEVKFGDLIWIEDSKRGNAYYKLNAIKDYSPDGGATTIELLKVNILSSTYPSSLNTTTIYKSVFAEGGVPGASGSGGGNSPGGIGTLNDLQDVELSNVVAGQFLGYDSINNIWTNKIVSNTLEGLTDVSIVSKADEDGVLWDSTREKWRNVPTVDISALFVKRAGDTMTGHLQINSSLGVTGVAQFGSVVNEGQSRLKGLVTFDDDIVSPVFVSGFAGSGTKLDLAGSDYNLTVDNLTVRKQMKVYELQIQKISSINGGLIISAANGKAYDVGTNKIYFDEAGTTNLIQFATDDYIRAQQWLSTGILYYLGKVTGVHHSSVLGEAYIDVVNISNTCWAGADLVCVGNLTNAARRNLIYLTATDDYNPYIDFLAGVTDGDFAGHTKLRLGNLAGVSDADFGGALTGYGMYADNVYLKGAIRITGGTGYGNLTDKPTSLASINSAEGTKLTGIEAGATVGATSAQVSAIASAATTSTWSGTAYKPNYVLPPTGSAGLYMDASYFGFHNGTAWKAYIDWQGNANFDGVLSFGTKPTYYSGWGNTASIAMQGADIWENTAGGNSGIYINRKGKDGGFTQPREFLVGDGRGNDAMYIAPSTQTVYLGNHGSGSYNGLNLWHLNVSGSITADDFIMSSDETLKQNIKPVSSQRFPIQIKEFEFKTKPGEKRVGVIAQEVQKIAPEFVHEDKDGKLSVSYMDLLMRKMAEMEKRIEYLETYGNGSPN